MEAYPPNWATAISALPRMVSVANPPNWAKATVPSPEWEKAISALPKEGRPTKLGEGNQCPPQDGLGGLSTKLGECNQCTPQGGAPPDTDDATAGDPASDGSREPILLDSPRARREDDAGRGPRPTGPTSH